MAIHPTCVVLVWEKIIYQPTSPNDNSIMCYDCKNWCHISCAGVSEDQFNNEDFHWVCPYCSPVDFVIQS